MPASPTIDGDSTRIPSSEILTFAACRVILDELDLMKSFGLFPRDDNLENPFRIELVSELLCPVPTELCPDVDGVVVLVDGVGEKLLGKSYCDFDDRPIVGCGGALKATGEESESAGATLERASDKVDADA